MPGVENHNSVGDARRSWVVRRKEHNLVGQKTADALAKKVPANRIVHSAHRVVKQVHVGVRVARASHGDALPLAAAEREAAVEHLHVLATPRSSVHCNHVAVARLGVTTNRYTDCGNGNLLPTKHNVGEWKKKTNASLRQTVCM